MATIEERSVTGQVSWRDRLVLTALLLVGGALAAVLALSRGGGATAEPSAPMRASLQIEPFATSGDGTTAWPAASFADSLAARLARTPGLNVRVAGRGSDYSVRGDVTTTDGRLVIAARLYRSGEEAPVWSATFWRSREAGLNLVDALAADVAEALYGHLARQAVGTTGDSR